MSEFTASNGITVFVRDGGTVQFQHGTREESCGILQVMPHSEWWQALREYFRAEEDERLGRWRWTEDRDVYVRAIDNDPHHVEVHDEASGEITSFTRGRMDTEGTGDWYLTRAARAYFQAHPESKPWHYAKPGDVWLLKTADDRRHALIWRSREGDWDLLDPRGDSQKQISDPIAALAESGYDFSDCIASRLVEES